MKKAYPKLLISDENNNVYDLPHLEAAGMKGGSFFRLDASDLVELPEDSELFMLPDRMPVGYDPDTGEFAILEQNPYSEKARACYAVAAFLPPGFTGTYSASYKTGRKAVSLPLFSYAAAVFYRGKIHAAGVRVDRERRQQLAGMDIRLVEKNVRLFRKRFPENRLVRHLERCALCYGCPAAKNFFLKRYEGPLPASPTCNARCIGCISYQPGSGCSVTQPRIEFVPTPEEIAEVALAHISAVRDPVVSFGQGCEGEPLMVGEVILEAVKIIRKATAKGVININTNASRPRLIGELFDAGVDSIRVSLNSVREEFYNAYYKPDDYIFSDVVSSIRAAKKRAGFVSLNYLTMPGFTDLEAEVKAFLRFLENEAPDMIQWRNLNYDPEAYFAQLKLAPSADRMIGIRALLRSVKERHPQIMQGYFNPSLGRVKRHLKKHDS
ncbi:MAG: radical SAM protein [Candidatus Omnitrophica bacterium]|nr:radical SAM protein [Candidatus Omnitrophota bacterium]